VSGLPARRDRRTQLGADLVPEVTRAKGALASSDSSSGALPARTSATCFAKDRVWIASPVPAQVSYSVSPNYSGFDMSAPASVRLTRKIPDDLRRVVGWSCALDHVIELGQIQFWAAHDALG
jgi:hypothetical protein